MNFLGLPAASLSDADVCLLPLPYEGTVSYGGGTSQGPSAILHASTQVELFDEELLFELDRLNVHTAEPVIPGENECPADYHRRVKVQAETAHASESLVVGVGGEHSVTVPLVAAAMRRESHDSSLTIVQIDAHADLRETWEGTPYSHACAMRRLTERGASLISIGTRSLCREEWDYANESNSIRLYRAQSLVSESCQEADLLAELQSLSGNVYLTIDVDGLDMHLCPATGTPEPGGLSWWTTLRYLRTLLTNQQIHLTGCDLVETVPLQGSQVNEFTSAKLLSKVFAYWFASRLP